MSRYILTGVKGIDRALKQLEPALAKKAIRQGMRAALRPVKQAVRMAAPVRTGATKKAVKIRASKSRKKGVIGINVQIGKGDYQGERFYASFQEFGWKTGKRRDGVHKGRKRPHARRPIPGKHFMKKAFDATKDKARDDAQAAILAKVKTIVAGLKAKG